jgi:hypothetical protein
MPWGPWPPEAKRGNFREIGSNENPFYERFLIGK